MRNLYYLMKLVLLGTKRKVEILIENNFFFESFSWVVFFVPNRELDLTYFNPNHRLTVRVFD